MEERKEKAIFVGVIKQGDDERQVMEYLDELEFLAETAGAEGGRKFLRNTVDSRGARSVKFEPLLPEEQVYTLLIFACFRDVFITFSKRGQLF